MARFTLDPKNPPELTPEEQARLEAMTDEEITAAALSDPDNPPMTEEEIDRIAAARAAKIARQRTGLTQREFARRYRINFGRLRDIEQARNARADSALVAYLTVIAHDPEAVDRALSVTAT
ncbi:XRE family transcriptional regulator [Inquilinus sp. YAF38]|uniref:helix-turn-helix domain-containing protein n=1 Tax=Inquilinus sp. YAF38 TaxID=3233084 RepID=UPI003F92E061